MSRSNDLIEKQLDGQIQSLEAKLDADVMFYLGPIEYGVDDEIRDAIESIDPRRPKLAVLLETLGGTIEVAQRIVDTLRYHYDTVDFFIPNHAMSAGTVLVMSGNAIWMDYYSTLGPIDPQVENAKGYLVPALGYLLHFNRLIEKSKTPDGLSQAELAFLLQKFDPAELYYYEQAKNLSTSLLKEWLANYKFKDWTKTETRKVAVTPELRTIRAEEIAKRLNDTDHWYSHARGIPMRVLKEELNLKIEDIGADPELKKIIRDYRDLLVEYAIREDHNIVIHTRNRFRTLK